MRKTDNPAEVGKHQFELAGLGLAPFRFVGLSENVIKIPGGESRAGGSCDFCGTGIRYEFHILSADGRRSKVGCDCIAKVGDAGLIRAYKSSPGYRKMQREKRAAKAAANLSEINFLMDKHGAELRAHRHPHSNRGESFWQRADWMRRNAGAAGRATLLFYLRRGEVAGVAWANAEAMPVEAVAPAQATPAAPAVSSDVLAIADRLDGGDVPAGKFRESIAESLRNGRQIYGRAADIVCDILAKQQGRDGSAAYKVEYDRVHSLLF